MDNEEVPKNYSLTLEGCGTCRVPNSRTNVYGATCGMAYTPKNQSRIIYCTKPAEFRGHPGYWVCSKHRHRAGTGSKTPSPEITADARTLRRKLPEELFIPAQEPSPLPPTFGPNGLEFPPRTPSTVVGPTPNRAEASALDTLNAVLRHPETVSLPRDSGVFSPLTNDRGESPLELMKRVMAPVSDSEKAEDEFRGTRSRSTSFPSSELTSVELPRCLASPPPPIPAFPLQTSETDDYPDSAEDDAEIEKGSPSELVYQALPSPTRQHKRGIRTHLIFHEEGSDPTGWVLGDLTENELECLNFELKIYNDWIKTLLDGQAPLGSYHDSNDPDKLLRAHHRKIYEPVDFPTVGERGYYETLSRYLSVVCESDRVWPFYVNSSMSPNSCNMSRRLEELELSVEEDADALEYEEQYLGTLADFLYDPLAFDDCFSMGYKALPLTARLLREWHAARDQELDTQRTKKEPQGVTVSTSVPVPGGEAVFTLFLPKQPSTQHSPMQPSSPIPDLYQKYAETVLETTTTQKDSLHVVEVYRDFRSWVEEFYPRHEVPNLTDFEQAMTSRYLGTCLVDGRWDCLKFKARFTGLL